MSKQFSIINIFYFPYTVLKRVPKVMRIFAVFPEYKWQTQMKSCQSCKKVNIYRWRNISSDYGILERSLRSNNKCSKRSSVSKVSYDVWRARSFDCYYGWATYKFRETPFSSHTSQWNMIAIFGNLCGTYDSYNTLLFVLLIRCSNWCKIIINVFNNYTDRLWNLMFLF